MKEKIIVTGSNGQLGKELVNKLIGYNYDVIGVDNSYESEKDDLMGFTKKSLDITNENGVEEFFKSLKKEESIVGLINNAGTAVFSPFEDRTYMEIKSVVDVNICWNNIMTKNFMKFNKDSLLDLRVVNLGSIYGEVAPDLSIYDDTPRMSSEIYGMTKAAIINFTKYLASNYKCRNARFNCVSPGGIEHNQGPNFKNNYKAKVPLNRMANAEEVAEIICFLMSKKSSYINGENIFVDGGFTKW